VRWMPCFPNMFNWKELACFIVASFPGHLREGGGGGGGPGEKGEGRGKRQYWGQCHLNFDFCLFFFIKFNEGELCGVDDGGGLGVGWGGGGGGGGGVTWEQG